MVKNINIPIGILRFSACGGQGTTRIFQNVIFLSFCRFSENYWEIVISGKFNKKLMIFMVFEGFGGPSRSDVDFEQGIHRVS